MNFTVIFSELINFISIILYEKASTLTDGHTLRIIPCIEYHRILFF